MSGPWWRVDFRSQSQGNCACSPVAMVWAAACWVIRRLRVAVLVRGFGAATRGGRHFILRSVADAAATGGSGCQRGFRRCERRSWSGATCRAGRPCRDSRRQTGQSSRPVAPGRLDGYASSFDIRTLHHGRGMCAGRQRLGSMRLDQALMDHEFCARALQSAVVFDQLSVSEFACMEMLRRKMQMAECRHHISSGPGNEELQEDLHMYMVTGETLEMLMIAPAWSDDVTEEVHRETNVLKLRRKMSVKRDRRLVVASRVTCRLLHFRARSTCRRRSLRSSSPNRAPPQKSLLTWCARPVAQRDPLLVLLFVESLSCNEWAVSGSRRRGSGRRQQKHIESWVSEALRALKKLSGRPHGSTAEKLTLGQKVGVCNVRETLHALGSPPCSVASARRELRLARPGYDMQPATAVLKTERTVAVPCDAAEADFDSVLTGKTKDMWVQWQDHILRGHESQGSTARSHFDPRLKSSQRVCLGLCHATGASGYD